MKSIYLFFSLFFISSGVIAKADPPTDCSTFTGEGYAHCTHFVEQLPDPFKEGYMMQVYYKLPDGTTTPILIETCLNSNSEFNFYMDNEPGSYTQYFKMGYFDENQELYFEDYQQQTFYHSGTGPANPHIFTVFIDSAQIPVTCDKSIDELTVSGHDVMLKISHKR